METARSEVVVPMAEDDERHATLIRQNSAFTRGMGASG
jgi:hypothetical protein